jgi:hypothetical protein
MILYLSLDLYSFFVVNDILFQLPIEFLFYFVELFILLAF